MVNRTRRREIAAEARLPVLIKAIAGGGGKGMKVVHRRRASRTRSTWPVPRHRASFGNADVYIAKWCERARHVEVQFAGGQYGHVFHLGEHDCTIQRRHQKLIEETPSPGCRSACAKSCVRLCRGGRRQGDGLRGAPGPWSSCWTNRQFLLHGNEHPHPGRASGDRDDYRSRHYSGADSRRRRAAAALQQSDIKIRGHSIECRINAEDPVKFTPCPAR